MANEGPGRDQKIFCVKLESSLARENEHALFNNLVRMKNRRDVTRPNHSKMDSQFFNPSDPRERPLPFQLSGRGDEILSAKAHASDFLMIYSIIYY